MTILAFTIHDVGASSKLTYQIWIGAVFAMEGGHFSIFPAVAASIYGAQLGSRVYSLLFIGTAIASFISLLVANFILPLFGWKAVYMLFAVICLFSLLLLMVFEEKPKIAKRQGQDMETYYKLMVASKQDSNKVIYKSSDSEGKRL